jgi:hypothetical protein
MNRGVKKICAVSYVKCQKTEHHHVECGVGKENVVIKSENGNKKETKDSIIFPGEKKLVVEDGGTECIHCCEQPCV